MKKLLFILISLSIIFILCACDITELSAPDAKTTAEETSTNSETTTDEEETTDPTVADTLPDSIFDHLPDIEPPAVNLVIEDKNDSYITIRWCNYSDNTIYYNLDYTINAKYEHGGLQVYAPEKSAENSKQYFLPPMSSRSHTYSLGNLDTSKEGMYRFQAPFGDGYLFADWGIQSSE